MEILDTVASEQVPPTPFDEDYFLNTNFYSGQIKYIRDRTTYKSLFGGKRSGKSSVSAGDLIFCDQTVLKHKKGFLIYASSTVEHAKELSLHRIMQANKKHKFKYDLNLSKNVIKTPYNTILFMGLKDLKSVYDHQGIPVKKAVIDEPQFVKEPILKAFVYDVVAGGMIDFEGQAQCSYIGNPFPIHSGFLWDELKNPKVSSHELNLFDNSFIKEKQKIEFLKNELEKRGEVYDRTRGIDTRSNATKRLLFGEWSEDISNLVLRFTKDNHFQKIPSIEMAKVNYYIGIDLGWHDKCAIVVIAHNPYTGKMWCVYEWEESHITITPLAEKIKYLLKIYDTRGRNIVDSAGGGKQIAQTLKREHQIPMIAAEKPRKMDWVRHLQDAVDTRQFMIKSDSQLLSDSRHLLFKNQHQEIDEDHFHSDTFHAALYAFRYVKSQTERVKKLDLPTDPVELKLIELRKNKKENPLYEIV